MTLSSSIDGVIEIFQNQSSPHLCFSIDLTRFKDTLPEAYALLSEDEKRRADRYIVEPPKVQFTLTRACLRYCLGKLLKQTPTSIQFSQTQWGKLFVKQSLYHFNVSHTDGMAVLLISQQEHVGVDIEKIRDDFAAKHISNRFFSEAEQQWLATFNEKAMAIEFFKIWCGKEAISKAIGLGMQLSLACYDVVPKKNTLTVAVPQNKRWNRVSHWALQLNYLDTGYIIALSFEQEVESISIHSLKKMER